MACKSNGFAGRGLDSGLTEKIAAVGFFLICEEMDETYNHVLYRLKQLEEGLFIKKNIDEPERKRWDKWYAV